MRASGTSSSGGVPATPEDLSALQDAGSGWASLPSVIPDTPPEELAGRAPLQCWQIQNYGACHMQCYLSRKGYTRAPVCSSLHEKALGSDNLFSRTISSCEYDASKLET